MSLINEAIVADMYGLRLTVDQLAQAFNLKPNTIHNRLADGTLPIPSYVDGKKRYFDYRDVATYLDRCREQTQV